MGNFTSYGDAMQQDEQVTIGEIGRSVGRIEASMVTQAEFQPVARIVYGLCALLLAGMIAGILKLILISGAK